MKGVLIVGHGSRRKETALTLESVVEMARKRLPYILVEIAYMEFSERSIPAGLDALTSRGANEIAVVPYFLFDGIHIREDIPEELKKYRAEHPDVKITMGKPLGEDERLGAILADRVLQCL